MREEMKRAVDIACRAESFSEQLHEQGFIRRSEIVRETIERIVSLETEQYPVFVIDSILETAEVLKRMLDKANFDSGKRRYYPLKATRRGHHE